MAGWWTVFVSRLIEKLPVTTDIARFKNMIFWESSIWILLLLCAGMALLFYIVREDRQTQKFRTFVAAFTHDLKTSLTSLRLQVESLKEDLSETPNPLISRLMADTARLQLQLENTLFLAHGLPQKFYYEQLKLSQVLDNIQHSWPQIKIRLLKDVNIYGDERAINSILRNIIHNSVTHGQASEILITTRKVSKRGIAISIKDNGFSFSGDRAQLGRIYRHHPSSGSGVGLYIVSKLMNDMNAKVSFPKVDQGFQVDLEWAKI